MEKGFKTITAKESALIDRKARERLGISSLVLMENAGYHIAEEAIAMLGKHGHKVAVFCGKGNNGGDGLVAARHLIASGMKPDVFLAGKASELRDEARINAVILIKAKYKIRELREEELNLIKTGIKKYSLIIDALLGIGLKGETKGIIKGLIDIINSANLPVLSVDLPSGLDVGKGRVFGSCIRADKTITFFALKKGMLKKDISRYCGEIIVKGLGVPLHLL